jgi:hypothetical protein
MFGWLVCCGLHYRSTGLGYTGEPGCPDMGAVFVRCAFACTTCQHAMLFAVVRMGRFWIVTTLHDTLCCSLSTCPDGILLAIRSVTSCPARADKADGEQASVCKRCTNVYVCNVSALSRMLLTVPNWFPGLHHNRLL